ncbi:palmitoyltransferase zdhhc2 [Lasius niger]|uniref:Palmitoyltransferase n=1 Tax=Lasius niger TaxID=67767 RepID=A0A0J7KQ95_LASNI|nr:palmitoyltransferase zdhhc2 [Lasius niger]
MGKQNGSCWWCVKAVKWIPVIFILTIVAWSYYAYVVQLCYYTIDSYVQKAFYLLFFHILILMFLWSYWQTVYTNLMPVPDKFKIPDVEMEKLQQAETEETQRQILERFAQDLPVTNRTIKGAMRFCEKCQLIKPDRAHHCSVCGTCVLKMDHHCPWGELDGMGRFHLLFLFFVALMFAVSLNSLFFYHCYLVVHNRSTLEAFRTPMFRTGKDKDGFSLGKYNNFQEVFGDNPRLWFLPIFSSLGRFTRIVEI